MTMSMTELERSLRSLRLSGMTATLENRALQVAQQQMDFIEAFSALVQDELDRRRSRLIERRFSLSGLQERKNLKDIDWQFNPKLPKRQILELAVLKFIDEREDALFIGSPGVGKSHAAKALALLAVQRGYTVIYREAHVIIDDIHQARELGELKKYRATLKAADLVVIDDLFLRKLPPNAGDELADVIMSRYEKSSTLITSNREIEDWGKLLGDVVIVAPLLDRLMHHGNLLKFVGKSWRLKESAERLAKARQTA
ncbi:MAG: IS21-like element helper ATPase IstB [Acidobacteriota bacterium]|nr:IS21-like element helper ATPase IstB [Acidobacteriota bacterium]